MQASINVIPECSIAEIVELAVRAESLGFDRCWVYDEGLVTRDVYVTLAAIATATSSIHLGPGITNPYTRHPAQTASAIASLDELSEGRAFLGIGAGGSLTLDPVGIDRARPLRAVGESIDIARALFGHEPATYEGGFASLAGAQLAYGRSDIEIWLAGRGPKMLALGGAKADGVMLDFIYKPQLADAVSRVRSGGKAKVCYSTAVVTSEADLDWVRPHMTYRLVDTPEDVREAVGVSDNDVRRIRTAMAGGLEAAAEHVRDEWILPFVIAGTPDEAGAEIAELGARHGLDEFLIPMVDMPDQLQYLATLAPSLTSL